MPTNARHSCTMGVIITFAPRLLISSIHGWPKRRHFVWTPNSGTMTFISKCASPWLSNSRSESRVFRVTRHDLWRSHAFLAAGVTDGITRLGRPEADVPPGVHVRHPSTFLSCALCHSPTHAKRIAWCRGKFIHCQIEWCFSAECGLRLQC